MARPCITQQQKCPSCLWARNASRELFAFKMCSQRHIKQQAQPSGAPPTDRPSKCTISSVTRVWSGMTTHTTAAALYTRACLNMHQRARDASWDPSAFCTQKMLLAIAPSILARATLGRTNPLAHPNAPARALYGPGVAHPRPQPQKRSTCVLSTRPKASWDYFARKRCSQRQHTC